MVDTSPAVTRSSRRVVDKMQSIPEAPNAAGESAPKPSANVDNADSTEDMPSDIPWRRRTTMLKTKTKKEGINPLGLAAVTLILGCILGCPYRALDWSHLNYFDLAMLVVAAILFCFMLLLVVLGIFGSDDE